MVRKNSVKKNFEFCRNHLSINSVDLTLRSPYTLCLPLENIKKPYGFLIVSGGRERVQWERMV